MKALLAVSGALALCGTGLGSVAAVTATGPAKAARSGVTAHRHFVHTPNGLVEVGPRACDDPAARDAFEQFHAGIHVGVTAPRRLGRQVITRNCD